MNRVISAEGSLGVLVTRPAHQSSALSEQLTAMGHRPTLFPVLAVRQVHSPPPHWSGVDRVIFISANAVIFALDQLDAFSVLPDILAIGRKTAETLRLSGVRVALYAPAPFNTQALLSLPEMQQVRNQCLVIVRGVGGSPLLAEALRQRGAVVNYWEVYQRYRPDVSVCPLLGQLQRGEIQVVVITSVESLTNFYAMIGIEGRGLLAQTILLAISRRVANAARQLSLHQHVLVSEEASDEGLIEAISRLDERTKNDQSRAL